MFHVKHISSIIKSSFSAVSDILKEQKLNFDPIVLDDSALEKLCMYVELMESWTKKLDLVGPGGQETLVDRHLRDAFAVWLLLEHEGVFERGECMDIGSGAGLPGVVFACMSPKARFVLCEPREKRVVFLQEVKRRLQLDCRVIKKRVEELVNEDVKEVRSYIFRALTPEPAFIEHLRSINAAACDLVFMTGAQNSLETPVWSREIRYFLEGDSRGRKISFAKIIP